MSSFCHGSPICSSSCPDMFVNVSDAGYLVRQLAPNVGQVDAYKFFNVLYSFFFNKLLYIYIYIYICMNTCMCDTF